MTHDEFKDYLFDILNETDKLPILDINAHDQENLFLITLKDFSEFTITTSPYNGTLNSNA